MQQSQSGNCTMNDYIVLGTLGRGAYGEVVLAKHKNNDQEVAIKMLDKKFLARERKQYQVFVEKEVLTKVNHPGVIKLVNFFQSPEKIYFVVEFSNGGDFANFLKLNKTFSFKSSQFYVAQIVCQIEALHINGIAHRDVKPENILLTKEGHLKMIDFGTASFFDPTKLSPDTLAKLTELRELSRKDERGNGLDFENEDSTLDAYQSKHKATFVGTAEYVSPELLEDDICGPEADLWALGCIVYKMFTGKTPFQDSTEYLVFQKIKSCSIVIPDSVNPDALSLISKLLLRDPTARLGAGKPGSNNSFEDLKKHSFFKGINWETIFNVEPPQDVIRIDTKKAATSKDDSDDEFQSPGKKSSMVSSGKSKIIISGLVDKKVGFLIYKARQLILNDSEPPKLTYYDPQTNVKKGEIELNDKITIEMEKNGFNIDVPQKKKYYFKQIEQPANVWVTAIKKHMDSKGIKCRLI